MKSAFFAIGLTLWVGGVTSLMNPGPMTVFPSGSKWRQSVEISADKKKVMGVASVALGALAGIAAIKMKRPSAPKKIET